MQDAKGIHDREVEVVHHLVCCEVCTEQWQQICDAPVESFECLCLKRSLREEWVRDVLSGRAFVLSAF